MKKSIQMLLLLTSLLTLAACDPDDGYYSDSSGTGSSTPSKAGYRVQVKTDGTYYESSGGKPCGSGNNRYVCLKMASGPSIIAPKGTAIDIVGTYSIRNEATQRWETKNIYESTKHGTGNANGARALVTDLRLDFGYKVDAVKININVLGYYDNKTFSKEYSFSNETVWDMATGVTNALAGTGASFSKDCSSGKCAWFITLKKDLILTQDDSYAGKNPTVNSSSRGNSKSDLSGRSVNPKTASSSKVTRR